MLKLCLQNTSIYLSVIPCHLRSQFHCMHCVAIELRTAVSSAKFISPRGVLFTSIDSSVLPTITKQLLKSIQIWPTHYCLRNYCWLSTHPCAFLIILDMLRKTNSILLGSRQLPTSLRIKAFDISERKHV